MLESACEQCFAHELSRNRIDILVENQLIVELKSFGKLLGIHEAQLLTYMNPAAIKIGLLMNFNVTRLKEGIKRFML